MYELNELELASVVGGAHTKISHSFNGNYSNNATVDASITIGKRADIENSPVSTNNTITIWQATGSN